MRTVRIDDMPYGTPNNYVPQTCRDTLGEIFDIFNAHQVPFIIGAVPLIIEPADIDLMNARLGIGRAVMHGFDHGFSRWREWGDITLSWPLGGEFAGMSVEEIDRRYKLARIVMNEIKPVDHTQFIAPFNCYTQALLDTLNMNGVTKVHTLDTQYNDYNYAALQHGSCRPVIAQWQVGYNFGFRIINKPLPESQIVLHWMYDVRQDGNWRKTYLRLCQQINEEAHR